MKSVLGGIGRVAQGVGGVAKGVGGVVFGEAKAALTAVPPDDEGEVEALLQRVQDGLMPEYRREAMVQLKELLLDNPKAQLALGTMGIPVLVTVLQDDRDDLELLRGALECLVHAMAGAGNPPPQGPALTPQQQQAALEAQAGAVNAEMFARKPEHVALLLALIEDEPVGVSDFYVRYHTVQLLTSLLQVCAYKLTDAILSSPMGVVRLMDMLMEREVIRNEALLLLVALTRSNEEVQKIAAFEGAFDRIFNIIREEGGADGGVVVQDCLELLNNLLRANQANQRLFREMGYIQQLPRIFSAAVPQQATSEGGASGGGAGEDGMGGGGLNTAVATAAAAAAVVSGAAAAGVARIRGQAACVQISRQKASILLCALETVMLLAAAPPGSAGAGGEDAAGAKGSSAEQAHSSTGGAGAGTAGGAGGANAAGSNRGANQAALLQSGLLEALLPLALVMGGVSSVVVRTQSLQATGDLVSDSPKGQERLGASTVMVAKGFELPALQAALRTALTAEAPSERAAAEHLIKAFCRANPEGQITLVSTIAPVGDATAPATFGSELAAALVMGPTGPSGLQVSCRAASVLQHLLVRNAQAKERLLVIPIEMPTSASAPPELLLPRCIKYLSEALRAGTEGRVAGALLLRLLVVWLTDCPAAISALLAGASHLPLLVDLVTGRVGAGGPGSKADAPVAGLAAVVLGVCLLYGAAGPQPASQRGSQPPGQPPPQSPSDIVLDVLLSRVGLSTFFQRLDELRRDPAFVAASTVARLPKPVTRAAAAAATAGDAGLLDADGAAHQQQEGRSGSGSATPVPGSSLGEVATLSSVFDFAFTQLVKDLEAAVKTKAMEAFTKPAGGMPGSSGTEPGQDPLASLHGSTEGEKLGSAVAAIRRLETEAAELRARNRALAEDLFKVAGGGSSGGSSGGPGGPGYAGGAGGPGAQGAHLASGASSAADVQARVAAEMRANRAEMEAGQAKQQVEQLGARLRHLEQEAAAAREAAAAAHSTAAKYEADLKDLSGAYNNIETHSFQLEAQVRELQGRLAQAQAQAAHQAPSGPPAGYLSEAEVAARVEAAVAEAQRVAAVELAAARAAAASAAAASAQQGSGGLSEEEVQRRVEEAAAAAREEAEKEGEDQLTDLLVCLGQEEQKVALLSEKLAATGVDVEALLATIKPEEVEDGEGEAGEEEGLQ